MSYIRFAVITLMLFLAIDEFFYQYFKSTDAHSWHCAVWDHPLDVCMGGDWLDSFLCVGCLFGRLAHLTMIAFALNEKNGFH